ncbi:MAG: hypothetical protein QOE25_1129 [Actinomycetota bacterium]|nr:hypothetical protein [Actinomycetota bacterium]
MRGTRRLGVLGALGAFLGVGAFLPATASAGIHASSTTTTIAPGLTLTKVSDPAGPYQIRILTVDPKKAVSVDVATAGKAIGAYAYTSRIAPNVGALAAINGDFSVYPGRPVHMLMDDGTLMQSGIQSGTAFSEAQNELQGFVGSPAVNVAGSTVGVTGSDFAVNTWNSGAPGSDGIAAFTPYGGSAERPPSNACAVRLSASTKLKWTSSGQTKLTRDYTVDAAGCASSAMTFGKKGVIVLASRSSGTGASTLKKLSPGAAVRLTWTDGWTDSMDAIGGQPLLLSNGSVVAPATCGGDYFCMRNPRTGVGFAPDGRVFMVTVDGRCSCSVGMTLVQFAKEFQSLGATWAINLDGGGGTTMWVKGMGVVNRPSDTTGERPVTTALVVLPGPDPREPVPGFASLGVRPVTDVAVGPMLARQAGTLASTDPGSTGGLFQAMDGGWLGCAVSRCSAGPPLHR